jgi:predicted ArsR family transcriptional regulator
MATLAGNRAAALASLGDPARRAVYDVVAHEPEAIGRDAVARATGLPRSTAAFHLDRLVEAGLLTVEFRRLTGRTGPGAGRPAKLYRAAAEELIGSVPERHYELVGELLAAAAERVERDGTPMSVAVAAEARAAGLALGAEHAPLETALIACGYAPRDDGDGGIALENCPFHALARRHTDLVCGANLALVEGMAEATRDPREPRLVPPDGGCCVAVRVPRSP